MKKRIIKIKMYQTFKMKIRMQNQIIKMKIKMKMQIIKLKMKM